MKKKREEDKKKREEDLKKKREEELQKKEEEDEANQDSALEEIRAIRGVITEMRTNFGGGGVERLLRNLRRQRQILREFQKATTSVSLHMFLEILFEFFRTSVSLILFLH